MFRRNILRLYYSGGFFYGLLLVLPICTVPRYCKYKFVKRNKGKEKMVVSLIPFPSELSMLIHFSKNYLRKTLPKREK